MAEKYELYRLRDIIDSLEKASSDLTAPAYDSKWIAKVKSDIDDATQELEELLDDFIVPGRAEAQVKAETPFIWDSIPEIKPKPECDHDKAYAGWIVTSNPPYTSWICRKCKKQGLDEGVHSSRDGEDYRLILQETIDKIAKGGK